MRRAMSLLACVVGYHVGWLVGLPEFLVEDTQRLGELIRKAGITLPD